MLCFDIKGIVSIFAGFLAPNGAKAQGIMLNN